MDSPSPRSAHKRFNEEDESNNALASVWNSFQPLQKVISVLVVSLVLAALVFSSLPLWRPMGALMLHKLWDVLRFLLLTTGIGLGILNSRLWRGIDREVDSVVSSLGKADSFTSKVPFAGVFYGEVQHSYSLSDKEAEASENSLIKRTESERDVGPAGTADAATLTDRDHCDARLSGGHDGRDGNEASLRANNGHQPYTQPANLAVSTRRGIAHDQRDDTGTHNARRAKEGGAANEEVSVSPLIHMRHSAAHVVSRDKNRIVKPSDDLGLAAVAQQHKQNSRSKIVHRRGNSLEFTIGQEGSVSILDNCAVTNHQSAPQARPLSSGKSASSTDVKVPIHVTRKGTEPSGSSPANRAQHYNIDAGVPGAASKHGRSQSAYNLNDLLVQQRPIRKPGTSSQLSKRRNVSLSCDLDKEHTNRGMPAWLSSLPSPPAPPFVHGDNIAENRVMSANAADSKQDESSLKKAFTESLAPWRAGIKTVPVNIATYSHEELTQSNKDPLTKTMEKQMANTPMENTVGSPGSSELNKKVDAFIARFHERMRLQRLESLERSKQRGC